MNAATVLSLAGDLFRSLAEGGDDGRFLDVLGGGIGVEHTMMMRFGPSAPPEWLTCSNLAALGPDEMEALGGDRAYQTALTQVSLARPIRLTDVTTRSEILNSAGYNQVLRRLDGGLALIGKSREGEDIVITALCRSAARGQDFDDDTIGALTLLLPHLAIVSGMARRLAGERAIARIAFEVLDSLGDATLVLDSKGKLLHANRIGEEMLSAGNGIRRTIRGITAVSPSDDRKLQAAIRAAFALAIRGDDPEHVLKAATPPMQIAIGDAQPLVVTVVPARAVLLSDRAQRAVIVHIVDPARVKCLSVQALREQFDLTPREAALARHLTTGATLTQSAADLKISVGTARQYLKAVFDKTGVRRQIDLVRRIGI